jgi:hypothetical protein
MKLTFVEHPLASLAHPDEAHELPAEARCQHCAVAQDGTGRRFILWLSNGVHWALSRHDPAFGSDLRLDDVELIGFDR